MNSNKLTEKAQEAILTAQNLAEQASNPAVENEHLLLALLQQPDGVVPEVVRKLGADLVALISETQAELSRLPRAFGAQLYLSQRVRKVFDVAQQEAQRLHDDYVSTEHLLVGIAEGDGAAARILRRYQVTKDRIYQALTSIRGNQRVTDPNPEGKYQALGQAGPGHRPR
jgi:ATP-dependent Clp protease ATP-binding subunit ClpB